MIYSWFQKLVYIELLSFHLLIELPNLRSARYLATQYLQI